MGKGNFGIRIVILEGLGNRDIACGFQLLYLYRNIPRCSFGSLLYPSKISLFLCYKQIANLSWECNMGSKSLNISLSFVVGIELNPRDKE